LKYFFCFIISLIFIFGKPTNSNSAEILQINDLNTIIIGDQNRNLTINLICTDVDSEDESAAIQLLKTKFPRGTKVRIKPLGFKNNNLLAKIYKLNEDIEMGQLLYTNNLSDQVCDN